MCKLAAELVNIETTTSRIKEWCRLQRAEQLKTIAKKGHPKHGEYLVNIV